MIRNDVIALVTAALKKAQKKGDLPRFDLPEVTLERPKDPAYGDYATPVSMGLARLARMAPVKIAEAIVSRLAPADYLGEVTIAHPGFINFRLSDAWLAQQVEVILARGEKFGHVNLGQGKKVQVEYGSANPTGPLHVGFGRNVVLGDTLANVLAAAGYEVQREYLINDAGTQVRLFGQSLYARYAQALGRPEPMPEDGYQGEYIVRWAQEIAAAEGDKYLHLPPDEAVDRLARIGIEQKVLGSVRRDCERLHIFYDYWFSENEELHATGAIGQALTNLRVADWIVEKDGAIWLKGGDEADKANVVIRSDGRPTYLAADIAYVWNKLVTRRFDWAIYIWGADHHGHVPRLKSAAAALGLDPERVTVILYQLVTITEGGEEKRLSKRAGTLVELGEILDDIGPDVFRFMMLTRSADSQMELDLDQARQQSNENPVYYVQYGHARIASILRKAEEGVSTAGGDVSLLTHPSELELIRRMLQLEEVVAQSAETLSPHYLTHYAQELAASFHIFYRDCRVVGEDAALSAARLKLVKAAKIVLANTLHLIGVTAPEQM